MTQVVIEMVTDLNYITYRAMMLVITIEWLNKTSVRRSTDMTVRRCTDMTAR